MIARRVDRKIGSLDKTRLIGELPISAFCSTFLCKVKSSLCRAPAASQLFALSCLAVRCLPPRPFPAFRNSAATFAMLCIGIDL